MHSLVTTSKNVHSCRVLDRVAAAQQSKAHELWSRDAQRAAERAKPSLVPKRKTSQKN